MDRISKWRQVSIKSLVRKIFYINILSLGQNSPPHPLAKFVSSILQAPTIRAQKCQDWYLQGMHNMSTTLEEKIALNLDHLSCT